jgi:site-specific recombinase XerD
VLRVLGKGAKRRSVVIDAGAADVLVAWIEARAQLRIPTRLPLISTLPTPSRPPGPWSHQAARAAIVRASRRAGLSLRSNPHSFRHAHACRLVEAGAGITTVQRQLGHSSSAVTDAYLRSLTTDALAHDAVAAVAWLPEVAESALAAD